MIARYHFAKEKRVQAAGFFRALRRRKPLLGGGIIGAIILCALILSALVSITFPLALAATFPEEKLTDQQLESQAEALFEELRCVVCQNQSIAQSDADLARDLRQLVRERLAAGENEGEVKAFLVERYGEFILLRPPLRPATYILWLAPLLLGLWGAVYITQRIRELGAQAGTEPMAPIAQEEAPQTDRLISLRQEAAPQSLPQNDPGAQK
jgi:cytochrome c-type biogenesis protein CcmH